MEKYKYVEIVLQYSTRVNILSYIPPVVLYNKLLLIFFC